MFEDDDETESTNKDCEHLDGPVPVDVYVRTYVQQVPKLLFSFAAVFSGPPSISYTITRSMLMNPRCEANTQRYISAFNQLIYNHGQEKSLYDITASVETSTALFRRKNDGWQFKICFDFQLAGSRRAQPQMMHII